MQVSRVVHLVEGQEELPPVPGPWGVVMPVVPGVMRLGALVLPLEL